VRGKSGHFVDLGEHYITNIEADIWFTNPPPDDRTAPR